VSNVLSVPIEAVDNADGVPFVYRKHGGSVTRQEVRTGDMNEDAVVITAGLEEGDIVLLSAPVNGTRLELVRLPDSTVGGSAAGGDTAQGTQPVPAKDSADSTRS
jgi:hypothetical protein